MKIERNYEFRKAMRIVHRPGRRDAARKPSGNEMVVASGWKIVYARHASALIVESAKDLQDYFFTSMDTSLLLERVESLEATMENGILIGARDDFPAMGEELSVPRSYLIKADEQRIIICGGS